MDEQVRKDITSPDMLANISSRLSPYAVIEAKLNSSAIFVDDHGIGDLVDSIDFQESEPGLSAILILKMKSFVRLPKIQPLTSGVYVDSFWQTNKFDWAFEIRVAPTAVKTPNGMNDFKVSQILPSDCKFYIDVLND